MKVQPTGPVPAPVLIVGEAPGEDEEARGVPFVGTSGRFLDHLLNEAGIDRMRCRITNVTNERPPRNDIGQFFPRTKKHETPIGAVRVRDRWASPEIAGGVEALKSEIQRTKPHVIVALGGTPLWALCGHNSILKWRGSMLYEDISGLRAKVIPTYHPAYVLRVWKEKTITAHDLRRASLYQGGVPFPTPAWSFTIRPSLDQTLAALTALSEKLRCGVELLLSVDIETRLGHIACIGIAWSKTEAISIPLMARGKPSGYWSADEEAHILNLLRVILTHPLVRVVGQNFLYDAQYFWKWLHYVPRLVFDTIIGQHALFSDLRKNLGFLASLHCQYYKYWKDDGKHWNDKGDETVLWHYNCLDCVYTYEVYESLVCTTNSMGLGPVQQAQQDLFWPVLRAMQIGIRVDKERRAALNTAITETLHSRREFLVSVLGHALNPNSPKQMKALFYDDLKLPVQLTRAKKGEPARATLNDEALQALAKKEPLVAPLINAIADIRTLGIFRSSFIEAKLDDDSRMRSSFNIGGSESGESAPKTYRISSSTNAFDGGANLQTIPSEKSKSLGKAAARSKAGGLAGLGDPLSLPNLRTIFTPDPGKEFFNGDLDRADLQVVAWEADDGLLKEALRKGVDIHLLNAFTLENSSPPALEELIKPHERDEHCSCSRTCYWEHYGPRKHIREFAKVFCHATNYVGKPPTVAAHTGRTIKEIERAQYIWFGEHPGIKKWHDRTNHQVQRYRFVENRFGYRWYIFDRLDNILPEAVAWIPQSTVSKVINTIWQRYHEEIPEVETLLQVHDSLAGQLPLLVGGDQDVRLHNRMDQLAHVAVPYEDPLVIPFTINYSRESWGACA